MCSCAVQPGHGRRATMRRRAVQHVGHRANPGQAATGAQEVEGEDMEGLGEDGQPMTKNRRHRTLRQQMLNKQAQQRYRSASLLTLTATCIQAMQALTLQHRRYLRSCA